VVAVVAAILVWCGAMGQPGSSIAPAGAHEPVQLKVPVFRPGIAPVPGGTQGHYELRHLRSRAVFTDRGVEVHLPSRTQPSRTVGWSVAGARAVRPQAEKPREAALLQREVPAYGGLRYPGVRPGVDLWFEEHAEGVEYGFRAVRGADLKRVELEYAGASEVRVVEEGRALEVVLEEGVLREQGLHCAQEGAGGTSYAVACRFTDARPVGRERWAYAIEVDVVEPDRPVVVDPVIVWNNYIGGSLDDAFDGGMAMTVSDAGEIFVVGTVDMAGVPIGIVDGLPVSTKKAAVIASFHPDGGFKNWRALHGDGDDFARAVTFGKDGMLYVAGWTTSTNFPNLPTYCLNHGAYPGGVGAPTRSDAFVAQFDPKTFKFLGAFLVGTPAGNEVAHGIAAGPDGRLYLVGQTSSPVFPGDVLNPDAGVDAGVDAGAGGDEEPYDAGVEGGRDGSVDAFVTRLLPSVPPVGTVTCPDGPQAATLEWSIVGRGSHDDVVYAVALDEAGKVYVTGRTASLGMLPALTVTRQHAGDAGNDDVFVARLDPATGTVEKSLYLGGLGNEEGRALALKGPGSTSLLVGGTTRSAGFPLITGSGVSVSDAFVVALDKDTLGLKGSSTFGGAEGDDEGLALAVDRSVAPSGKDIVYLGGRTTSTRDFPLVAAFDTRFGAGRTEGFVARLEVDAGAPSWSTLVGGEAEDAVLALSNQPPGRLLVGGTTSSSDLAPGTSGGKAPAGEGDLFLLQVDLTAPTPDGGTTPGDDGGTDPGDDGGTDPGDDGGKDAGPLRSPLGWSCDAGGTSGGPGALSLGILAGLALLARRRTREDRPG
jgi:uncharacterized protein (TIGR03382 family)